MQPPDRPSPADRPAGRDDPFRLEDEAAGTKGGTAPSPAPAPGAVPPSRVIVPPPSSHATPAHESLPDGVRREVSAATVRERKDPASVSRPGPLDPPPGWPQEVWAYPVRGRGWRALLAAASVVALADLLASWNAFLGALVWLPLVVLVLRWQVRAVAATATGGDEAPVAFDPKDLEPEALRGLLRIALRALAYVAPAGLVLLTAWLESPGGPGPSAGSWILAGLLLAAGLWLWPVLLFAEALGSPSLGWPWNAFPWALRGAQACAFVAGSWALLAFGTWLALPLARLPVVAALPLLLLWRGAALAAGLVGARGLGVLGRRFEP